MCGRFALFAGPEELARHFGVTIEDVALPPRYNVAQTQAVVSIRARQDRGTHEGVRLRWDLIPFWAKDPSIGHKMVNARADTAPEKPAFRVESCTILTTDANTTMAPIHDRMPVILKPTGYATWLGESLASPDHRALLRPAPDDRLVAEPVSTAANAPSHDAPDCIAPLMGQ